VFPYWLLFSVFAAGSLQHRGRSSGQGRSAPLLALGGLVVALMVGLRYEVGGDWANYIEIYNNFSHVELPAVLVSGDPAFSFLNWLASRLDLGVLWVNLVCGSIFAWGLITFARDQPNPWLAVVVAIPYLVIVVAMGYTRQAVAIGFIMIAITNFERRSLIYFCILLFFAAAFHKSALIVLPLLALAVGRGRIMTALTLIPTALLVYYLFVAGSVDNLMLNYVEAEYESEGAAVRIAMNVLPALVFILFQRRFSLTDPTRRLWLNFAIASLLALAFLFLSPSSAAVDRTSLYLIPLQIFVLCRLPSVFRDSKRTNGQLVLAVIAYSAVIQFVWLNYAVNASFWLPYRLYPLSE